MTKYVERYMLNAKNINRKIELLDRITISYNDIDCFLFNILLIRFGVLINIPRN